MDNTPTTGTSTINAAPRMSAAPGLLAGKAAFITGAGRAIRQPPRPGSSPGRVPG